MGRTPHRDQKEEKKERRSSITAGSALDKSNEPFSWEDYLRETSSIAASPNCFKQGGWDLRTSLSVRLWWAWVLVSF
ncbi:polycomb protein SCMH1-like isoform X1 [Lates japonicus]|uniref:Polycomb protein SCMH1-like isoform X1 n=1 Tax=Lates japonicus TaxID=270547 RepID=A0AAD3R5R2_LATJO|nr:polycomb protein SCMH1-like isoform X1 [Lates japonicus]